MTIAWTVTDLSTADQVLVEARHVGGSVCLMQSERLQCWPGDAMHLMAPLPLAILDEMRALRDKRVDERVVDGRAQT